MFDFEKLDVYPKARSLNRRIQDLLRSRKDIDAYIKNQLRRASISMVINIAEGSGKYSPGDKKNYYGIARGSTFECVSLFDLLQDDGIVTDEQRTEYYAELETISKMLHGLMQSQNL